MVTKVQLLPAGEEMLRLQASLAVHRAEPAYLPCQGEEYNGLEGEGDPLLGVKEEVTEHAQLQAMFGQPPVVHLPNPYYVDSSSEGEMEQGEMEKDQGQVVMMTEEGITVVTLSSDEEGGE